MGMGRGTGVQRGGRSLYVISGLVVILEPITVTGTDGVQGGLIPVEVDESHIEQRSDDDGGDGEGTKEPGELVLGVDRGQGKVEGGGESGLELGEGHDE